MARTRLSGGGETLPLSALPAAALRSVLREGYSRDRLRRDLLAGAVVGVIAIPLAMALAVAVGVPPQQGLYTTIVAGFFAALLGGSRFNVTGPTAAFVVVLAPIVSAHGIGGLLLAGAMAGVMLLALGLLRLGQLIQYIPHPVTTGFTTGIATVIAVLQLKDFFGLRPDHTPEHFVERVVGLVQAAPTASWMEAAIGAFTLALLVTVPRFIRAVPAPLIALPVAAAVAAGLPLLLDGFAVATLGSRFSTTIGDTVYAGIPPFPPTLLLPWQLPGADGAPLVLSLDLFRALVPAAFTIAMLGAIETLLCAVVADGATRSRHDPDAELLAQGVANMVTPFFGGIPATAAMARTAASIRNGATSPVASMTHALVVLAAVVAIAPVLQFLPMASLAALLLVVAWNMSEIKHFAHIVRVAPRSDVTVLLTCFGLTVVFDMVIAVTVGVVLAALLFMRRMADITHARLADTAAAALGEELPEGVLVYDIAGPLFFGAAQKAVSSLSAIERGVSVAIVRLDHVPAMDATGLVALESAVSHLRSMGVLVVISGAQEQPLALIRNDVAAGPLRGIHLVDSTREAMELARRHVASRPPRTGRHASVQ